MKIIQGDCLEQMRLMQPNSISAIVTDPPYGLHFMGKGWDHAVPNRTIWAECFRIMVPGAFLLAMGGTRTFHRLTCEIEDAGYEIRDCISWLYGSGFPKSHNNYGIQGYGTALKPAWEPIIMAMKPCDGTFKQNAKKWGQAGINIDGCRIGNDQIEKGNYGRKQSDDNLIYGAGFKTSPSKEFAKGRWPANVIFDEEAEKMLDEQSGIWNHAPNHVSDSGGTSRFFYCAKASSSERNEGLDGFKEQPACYSSMGINSDEGIVARGRNPSQQRRVIKNHHPTVKPLKLMEYLIKLVMPPKDGILLDPFAGSGTTILAARKLGYTAIGIEKEQQYCEIARARLAAFENKDEVRQLNLFVS